MGKPYGAKVAPPELPNDEIAAIAEGFSDTDRMITALVIVARFLFLVSKDGFIAGFTSCIGGSDRLFIGSVGLGRHFLIWDYTGCDRGGVRVW